MTRLQKKCLVAAAGTHFLLVVALLCSAFIRPAPKVDDSPILEAISPDIISATLNSGVKDAPPPPPPAPAPPVTQPTPPQENTPPPAPQPQPQPQPVVKPVEPTPEVEPDRPKDPDTPSLEPKKEIKPKPPHKIDVNLKPVKIKPKINNHQAEEEAEAEVQAQADAAKAAKRARDAKAKAYNNALSSIRSSESSSTTVQLHGDNAASSASYSAAVKSIYFQRWVLPDKADNDDAIAKASVTIARDGRVIEAHIIGPSGDSHVDRSVQQTLERVTDLPPFPEGMTESEKTYIINFNLQAKREALD